jgi:glycosyltransferase 2 family protein
MHKVPKVIRVLISLSLLVILFSFIHWQVFLDQVKNIRLLLVLATVPMFFLGVYFSTLRWHSILKYLKVSLTKKNAFRLYLEGSFLNNFLPASVGGDVYKYLILSKDRPTQKKEIIASMFFERGAGFSVFIFVNLLLASLFYPSIPENNTLYLLEIFISLGAASSLILYVFRKYIAKKCECILSYFVSNKSRVDIIPFLFEKINKTWIIPAIIYSFLFTVVIVSIRLCYLFAFGVSVNPIYVLFFTTIIQVAGVLPISLNSLGVSEGLMVFLYTLIGISPEIALGVALVERAVVTIMSATGALTLHRDQLQNKTALT